ncbi:MAG: THUMP domain-containing protein, partial [Thermodesulfobacteriota bacterium]
MSEEIQFFAAAPRGVSPILAEELSALGCRHIHETPAGVRFSGSLEDGYRVVLWSRTASRVVLVLASPPVTDENSCYDAAREVAWHQHMSKGGTFCVELTQAGEQLANTHYAALKVKDAVADQFREKFRVRPDVRVERPMVKIAAHAEEGALSLGIDLSGEGLHRRGYRADGVSAPLKENLAAAILLRARWPEIAKEQGSLCDPMCGSGTLLIEAALMASDTAPALFRDYFGFLGWKGHDPALWERLVSVAKNRAVAGKAALPPIAGCDSDPKAVMAAQKNIFRAGLSDFIKVLKRDLSKLDPPENKRSKTGLLITNPPYGERLGTVAELAPLYGRLGELLKEKFAGFSAAVFTGNPDLARQLGIWARSTHDFYNGPIPCKLLRFDVNPDRFFEPRPYEPPAEAEPEEPAGMQATQEEGRPSHEKSGDRPYRPRARAQQIREEKSGTWQKKPFPREGAFRERRKPEDRPYAGEGGDGKRHPDRAAKRPFSKRPDGTGEKGAWQDRERPPRRESRPYGKNRETDFRASAPDRPREPGARSYSRPPGGPAKPAGEGARPYRKRTEPSRGQDASRDRERPFKRESRPYGKDREMDFRSGAPDRPREPGARTFSKRPGGPATPAGEGKRPYRKRIEPSREQDASRDRERSFKRESRPYGKDRDKDLRSGGSDRPREPGARSYSRR